MKSNVIYRVKVIGTNIIIALIMLSFVMNIIFSYRSYSFLYSNYTKVFLEVTQSIEESDTHDLVNPSETITETQMKNLLKKFGFIEESNISKVKELSEILITMDEKNTISRGRRDTYNKLVNAQTCLESIVFLSNKYLKTNNDYNLKDDKETLLNDYLQIMIMRDTI